MTCAFNTYILLVIGAIHGSATTNGLVLPLTTFQGELFWLIIIENLAA